MKTLSRAEFFDQIDRAVALYSSGWPYWVDEEPQKLQEVCIDTGLIDPQANTVDSAILLAVKVSFHQQHHRLSQLFALFEKAYEEYQMYVSKCRDDRVTT